MTKLQIMISSWNKTLQIVAWVIVLTIKKNRNGTVAAQNNKCLALKDLAEVEKIILKNFCRKAIEDAQGSFTNYCTKCWGLGDDLGY